MQYIKHELFSNTIDFPQCFLLVVRTNFWHLKHLQKKKISIFYILRKAFCHLIFKTEKCVSRGAQSANHCLEQVPNLAPHHFVI